LLKDIQVSTNYVLRKIFLALFGTVIQDGWAITFSIFIRIIDSICKKQV